MPEGKDFIFQIVHCTFWERKCEIYNLLAGRYTISYMRSQVLGLPVDVLNRRETIEKIESWLKNPSGRPKMIVTAYSEFYVMAQKDPVFAEVIKKADLVTPDGISVLAAVKYAKVVRLQMADVRSQIGRVLVGLWEGLKVGGEILSGKAGESVTGVWLFSELTKLAEKKGWKVFLLGGWGDVASRTARMLQERFPKIRVTHDHGEDKVGTNKKVDDSVVQKINNFKPDLLFVQYNPVKQEKWMASHQSRLKAGVVMGVGGTFNEFLGDFKKSPVWMERMGLKWLWRVMVEPKRFVRILRAVIVFPWLVFRHSLR